MNKRHTAITNRFRDGFAPALASAFMDRFKIAITTGWNVFAMATVTARADGGALTKEHMTWINGFETAWIAAQTMELAS